MTPEDTKRAAHRGAGKITNKARVLQYIESMGAHGATDDETEVGTGLRNQSVTARRSELSKAGILVSTGATRMTRQGYKAVVWIVSQAAAHPEPPRTNKTPKGDGEQKYPIGQGWEYTQRVSTGITGDRHRIVWVLDLLEDVGPPDIQGDPNGYADGRLYTLIGRMWSHVRDHHALPDGEEWAGDNSEALAVLVKCWWCEVYQWKLATVDIPHCLDVATITQHPPPVGRWRIVSQSELDGMGLSLPVGFFRDGIPF